MGKLMELPAGFLMGLILGGILGFSLGFLTGVASGSEKEKLSKKESKAERLFYLACAKEDKRSKIELLAKLLDKYPNSQWANKALEEIMKIKRKG